MRNNIFSTLIFLLLLSVKAFSQVGEHRSQLSYGASFGYVMSNVGFVPKVSQGYHGGMTYGLSLRYVCEKYFNTICSIYGEVNYAQLGWKEDIRQINDEPVCLLGTETPMEFQRTINYLQIPVFAHLAWGREQKGVNFFFKVGPQLGIYLSDSPKANFNIYDKYEYNLSDRTSQVIPQDTMAIENKIDYGISAGLGLEYSNPKLGHFLLEGRYYYGLGNLYGDSKRDFFGRSNLGNIVVKLSYLRDI